MTEEGPDPVVITMVMAGVDEHSGYHYAEFIHDEKGLSNFRSLAERAGEEIRDYLESMARV